MSYQSLGFLAFSAAVVFLYYIVGRKGQKWVLALANLAFYAMAGVQYLPYILVTMLATYLTGLKMGGIYQKADKALALCQTPAEKKQVRADAKKRAKRWLVIGMSVTIGLLAVCKYTNFILGNVNSILKRLSVAQLPMLKIILPIGISFYSFMAISYVLDIYWKRYKAEKNFLLYAVYLSYFPHVVQGPIDRYNEFRDQVKDGIPFSYENLTSGAQLTLWGLFKKLVIADRLGMFVNYVFENWAQCDGMILIAAVVVYSIQIYADFSGCIDIVTGVSEAMGIRLRKNFNHPYFSKTMGEFWRRWHMSLQEWFKDYVYYPVSVSSVMKKVKKFFNGKGKNKVAELFASCFPVLVVWLITGIWHGASWRFVAWGMFHAMLLIGSAVFDPLFKKLTALLKIDTDNFGWRFWQMVRTFILCGIGRVFFRAESIGAAFGILKKCFTCVDFGILFNRELTYGMEVPDARVAFIAVCLLWCVDLMQEKMPLRKTLARQNILFRWLIIYAGIFAVIIFGIYGPGFDVSNFIYEQF